VPKCPAAGEIVCNYERQAELTKKYKPKDAAAKQKEWADKRDGCWRTPMQTRELFHRCVPALDQVEKSTSYECDGKAIKAKKRSSCVGLLTETETIRTNTTAGAQELMSALITTSYTVKEWFGDCFTLKYKILFFGSVVSLLLALVYVFLMKYIAGVLVWVLIVLVWLLLGLVSTMLLVKGGSFFWLEFSFAQIEVLSGQLSNREFKEVAALFDATEGVEQKVWCYAGHTAFVVTLVYMVAICAIQSQIKLAIRLIEVTAKIMQSIPLIVVAPVIEWACLLALGAYFALGVANIWTAELSTADLKAALATSTSLDCDAKGDVVDCVTRTFGPTNATASPLDNTTDESAFYPMMGWHIFGYLWCWQFYVGFKTVWTAAAVAEVFWTKGAIGRKSPTIDAFCHVLRYHSGSVAFGALVIAIVKAFRLVMTYVQARLAEAAKDNALVKALNCMLSCCLYCLEKCVKYLTHNAFVMVGIDGTSFCASAKSSFLFLLGNPVRVSFVQAMARLLGYLAMAFVSVLCTLLAYMHFDRLDDGEDALVSSTALPSALVLLCALLVAFAFADVWNIAVDATLFSFLLDEQREEDGAYGGVPSARGGMFAGVWRGSVSETNWGGLAQKLDLHAAAPRCKRRLRSQRSSGESPL
jgi:hypothetical protein